MEEEGLVSASVGKLQLVGNLQIPKGAYGVVIFAHGSGSSRHSPRNRYVAKVLQGKGLGTFLVDLLSSEEEALDEETRALRFDIPLLTKRLLALTEWLKKQPVAKSMAIGYFGASTGAAAALAAAAHGGSEIQAVVSRGGRPDLAKGFLSKVEAATLLIVGGEDREVIELNEKAFALLKSEKKLVIIPGATHLFEEKGALEDVAKQAADWFQKHLTLL
ncbi:MAG: dienelactone hydrolase family protein [Anaerolineae bacterium]